MSTNSELLSILDSVPIHDLLSTIRKKAKTGNKDVVSYIRAIFQGSSDRSDVAENRRFETFKCAIYLLQLKDLSSNTTSELLSLLLLKVDLFHTSNLVKLAEIFVDHAKESDKLGNKWVEIFCKVLSCLARKDSIVYQGTDMSGSELRKDIIASLFSDDSDSSCLVQFAPVLKDVDLSEEEVSLVVERLLKILPCIDLIELPSFVYQLLISSKAKCRHVLQNILSHFIGKDKQMQNLLYEGSDSENLIDNQEHINYRQTEGTVILMISVVFRHDQKVAKEFILLLKKMLHKPQLILSPFTFSTALSLSKIHRNSDEIFDTLKKSIVAAFQHKEKRQNSIWFRNLIQWDEDVLKLVKEAVKCSKFGWDHVCQGLVRFGFVALDAFGPRCIAGHAATKPVCPEGCDLGSHVIRDTFKSHRLVRQEIFDQILNRIVTKSQKPVSHYIDILSQIVQSDPLFLLDVLPKLVEILDYLHFLPHSNAGRVLQSIAPLLKISAPLKDALMLVLRKALFHRDIEAKKVAVCGYLTILKKINFIGKVSLSQSQTSVGSHASSASMISTQIKASVYVSAGNPTSKTMCLEIMGLLKRALMQQNEVRQLLYEGLYDVVLQNPSLKDIILELLLGQFEKYYNANESEVPLHFSFCFQDHKNIIILKEPLAHLITSVVLILFEGSSDVVDEDYDQSAQKMLENFMQKLMKQMLVVDDTDFHIAKDVDLDESKAENNLKTRLLLNIYESIMEYSFIQNSEFVSEDCEEFLKLYHKYKQIFDSTSKKKQSKTSKSKANPPHHLFSHVTLNFITKVMEALFIDKTFKHQEGLNLLRSDTEFVINIVTASNQRFLKMSDSGRSGGFSEVLKNPFNLITTVGKVLLKTYSDGPSSEVSSIDWDKLSSLFAEGLSCVFNFVHLFHRKNMNKFIISVGDNNCLSTNEALQYILKNIQKSVMKLLSDTDDDSNLKECTPLLSVIKTLYVQYMTEFKEEFYIWIKQLCSQQVFQSVAVSKAFISLCFSLGHQNENFLGFLKEVAFDMRYHLGNIDPDESVTGTPKYEIITLDVAKNVLPILFSNLEQCFEEIEWVLNFIKINTLGGNETIELWTIYNRLSIEQGICSRVSDVILIFYEVVQTGVSENLANGILKLVTRLYKVLTALTKYYLLLHKNKTSELHAAFEKLVKLSNMKLTTQVYAFITFIQMLSGEGNEKKKKTKGNAGAFKAVQDMKTIPSLVFEIESYEKNLIILSKKYKKDLTNKMKASTARDFRINAAVITTVLEQQENESIANTTADETNNDNPASQHSSPQSHSTHASPEKEDSDDHMSVNEDSSEEVANENEPLNTSLNIFGEDVPANKVKATPKKELLNVKRKRLGIRGNTKRR